MSELCQGWVGGYPCHRPSTFSVTEYLPGGDQICSAMCQECSLRAAETSSLVSFTLRHG